jgi:ComF family protein
MSFLETIIAVIAPQECLNCGREGSLLCPACLDDLPPAPPFGHPLRYLRAVQSITAYKGVAQDLVWRLKSGGARSAAEVMAAGMTGFVSRGWLLIPAPTATSHVRQRGYDQAGLLARRLGRLTGSRCLDALGRVGQAHQVGATRQRRLKQLDNSFYIKKPRPVAGAKLLLIDDVVTTGATLETAAKALLEAGAGEVRALTFAQTP